MYQREDIIVCYRDCIKTEIVENMKKKGYYEYENGIFPLKLWVHIGKDLKELIDSVLTSAMLPIVITAALRIPMLSGRATEDVAFLSRFRVRRLCR